MSVPTAKLERRGSKRHLSAIKSMCNTTLALPFNSFKDKQQRLMGRLNKMMGSAGGGEEEAYERKKSWEDIPILIGGAIHLTPEEIQAK